MQRLANLSTPAFLVDKSKVETNCERMVRKAEALGVSLRPHVKTHKTAEVARLQCNGSEGPITVSTLAEARFLMEAGFRDITYAVPVVPSKLDKAAALLPHLDRLNLLLDHMDTLKGLLDYAEVHDLRWSVFLKVDCGYHRAGVDPEDPAAIELGRALHDCERIDFRGVLAHAGHSYDCKNAERVRAIAEQEVAVTVGFAKRLREAGIACPEVSIGSTPTCVHMPAAPGVTELRPGNYALFDKFQADIGSCDEHQIAGTVLSSVIGHYPDRQALLLDAGALALGKDPGATHVDPNCGYGKIIGYPHLKLAGLSQEHGKVSGLRPEDFESLPVGTKVQILPNHVCLTAALYDQYHVVEEGRIVETWKPARGW